MHDLTKGSTAKHIVLMAGPIALAMMASIGYQFINLYFIAKLGTAATAGVSIAGNVAFAFAALAQILGVGTSALVAQAVGRGDQADANGIFNQAVNLSLLCMVGLTIPLYALVSWYLQYVGADYATVEAGTTYILWALPGYVLTFPSAVMGAALAGSGIVKPMAAVQAQTIVLNAILAPILIGGWGLGAGIGVKGAGLANSICALAGMIATMACFHRVQRDLSLKWTHFRFRQWIKILGVGAPASAEIVIMFLCAAVVYYAIRDLGAVAQAGYAIGTRVFQLALLPIVSIAATLGPIAGQNVGAQNALRVKAAFRNAVLIGGGVSVVGTLFFQAAAVGVVRIFDANPQTVAFAATFLHIRSWGLVAHSLVYTCERMFQGLGNTLPLLFVSGARFVIFAVPIVWLSAQAKFSIEQIWFLWVASVTTQAFAGLWLLSTQFKRRFPSVAGNAPSEKSQRHI